MKNFIDNLFIEGDLGIGSDWAGGASSALHIKSSQPSRINNFFRRCDRSSGR